MDQNNNLWLDNLRDYLYNSLLIRIIPSEAVRSHLVNEEAMKIWEVVFTHSSYNRNVGQNYESYETLGDVFLGANFVLYLLEKHLYNISSSEISNFKNFYMSKLYQADFARNLQMDRYVRIGGINVSTHISEDILEAFAGGLVKVGMLLVSKNPNDKSKVGAGNTLVFNLIVYLFRNVQLDYNVTKGPPKTQLKNMFDKLHWGEAVEVTQTVFANEKELQKVIVSFTKEAVSDLAKFGVKIDNMELGNATGATKAGAVPHAYLSALNALNSMGVTDLWINQRKIAEDMNNPVLQPLLIKAYDKTSKEGYVNIIFVSVQTNREGKIMQLIGIKDDGQQVILAETTDRVRRGIEGKKQLLELYLQK